MTCAWVSSVLFRAIHNDSGRETLSSVCVAKKNNNNKDLWFYSLVLCINYVFSETTMEKSNNRKEEVCRCERCSFSRSNYSNKNTPTAPCKKPLSTKGNSALKVAM